MLDPGLAGIIVLPVIADGKLDGPVEKLLHPGTFGADGALYILLETARNGRHRKHYMRTGVPDCTGDVAQGCKLGLSYGHGGDAAAVHHHGIESGDMGEAVVQRKHDKHHRILVDADDGCSLLHVRGIVAMSQQDTLRIGGSAGGVADVGIVVGADGCDALFELDSVIL